MALCALDSEIVIAAQDGNWKQVEALGKQVFVAFWETTEGQKLYNTANREGLPGRLMEEFHKRFDDDSLLYPRVFFVFRFQEIALDILNSEAYAADDPEVETYVPTLAEAHDAKVQELRRLMLDDRTAAHEIKKLRESSVAYRKAWIDACALDTVAPAKAAETEQRKALARFAHMVNESVLSRGAGSIHPKGGVVTLHVGNGDSAKRYDYPVIDFRKQLEAATIAGLID
jgi:hypothetical protein